MKTIDDLKIGDDILVKCDNFDDWEKRIFVKNGKDDSVICVHNNDSNAFKNGIHFNTIPWRYYKIPQEPEWMPFDSDDSDKLIGNPVINIKTGNYYLITVIQGCGVSIHNNFYNFNELLANFTFTDGSHCGKLKGGSDE